MPEKKPIDWRPKAQRFRIAEKQPEPKPAPIHCLICESEIPAGHPNIVFEVKTKDKEKKKHICAPCSGKITNQFMAMMQQMPELGKLAGMEIKKKSPIIIPGRTN